ncbi:heterokaryon incompatibility protein [Rutstroemia sp. NJR-2017a WRK4]|nr:heterokaryon incompatibility protein [Rutstroemia sp. NJR-2017a WRK4]
MSDKEEKEDDPTPNYHSLDIESLKAWWAVYEKSDKYQNHAMGPKVSLGHPDEPVLRKSTHIPNEAKVTNQDSHSCACGNPGHRSLDKWYSSWGRSLEAGTWSLDDDLLDVEICLEEIKSLVPLVKLVEGCCKDCRNLLDGIPAAIATFQPASQDRQEQRHRPLSLPYFPHVAAFYASAVRGCKLCILWEQQHRYPRRPWSSLNIADFFKLENRLKCLGKDTSFSVEIRNRGSDDLISTAYKSWESPHSRDLTLFLTQPRIAIDGFREMGVANLTMTGTSNKGISIDPEMSSVVHVDRSMMKFELAKRWVTDCLKHHPLCQTDLIHALPSRLLEIRENSVKLVLTAAWTHQPSYATLSHCWGDHKFQTLTQDNLDSFLRNIRTETLSKTFQDAIKTVQNFDFSYLWIDSICIIQDSVEDWTIESSKMASVYRGAVLNISAAGAQNGTEGLFLTPSTFVTKFQITTSRRGFSKTWTISNPPESISDTPLAKRAWALQERLLSPRSIHFTRTGLAWECKTGTANEISPQLLERKVTAANWHEIVNLYTKAQLSHASDKLVAISGIARALLDRDTGGYLAGLWRNGLVTQLPWRCVNFQTPSVYRAPSWSWAAVEGEVRDIGWDVRGLSGVGYFAVVDHTRSGVAMKGVDEFGEVVDGVLTLVCGGLLLGRFCTVEEGSAGMNRRLRVLSTERKVLKEYYGYNYALSSYIDDEVDVALLPLFSYKTDISGRVGVEIGEGEDESFCTCIRGLILRGTNAEAGEFKRVGSFWIVSLKSHQDIFLDALDRYGAETARKVCRELVQEVAPPSEKFIVTIR